MEITIVSPSGLKENKKKNFALFVFLLSKNLNVTLSMYNV